MDGHTAPNPFIIGVAGGSGSGKTTVSRRIQEAVGPEHIVYLEHDSYYRDQGHLPADVRARQNYDHPDSLDTPLLVNHIVALCRGVTVDVPIYDFASHTRQQETKSVSPAPIIVVEGILIFVEPKLRSLMNMRIFVDTDADLRFIRRLQRDVQERGRTLESVVSQYLATVRDMHKEFVEPSKRYAHIIVPEGGNNDVAMDLITGRIRALLGRR